MQVAPRPWTHHHTHRLFHLSFLTCSISLVITLAYGSIVVFRQVQAELVGISATVPQVSLGPTAIVPGSTENPILPPAENSQPALYAPAVTVSLDQDARGTREITVDGKKKTVPVFSNRQPKFTGRTNIKNAIIYLEVHSDPLIRSTTYADGEGSWSWESPESISPGVHTLTVTAQDPKVPQIQSIATLYFFIEESPAETKRSIPSPQSKSLPPPAPEDQGNLFDVFVIIPSQFKTVPPGDEVIANLKLVNFGSPGKAVDVEVQYLIEDSKGKIILNASETLAVATQLSIIKSFITRPTLPVGIYKLTVRVPSQDLIAVASDTFELEGPAVLTIGSNKRVDFTIVFQGLLALLLFFGLVSYFQYNKVSILSKVIKQVSEHDLKSKI